MKLTILVVLTLTSVSFLFAQFPPAAQNELQAGVGLTWINGQPYYAMHLRPEFSISNIGVGLDLNLEFDPRDKKIRTENFNEVSDYVSVIRYIRYGKEDDPVYAKLGALDYATLGHGSIINTYNNSPSFDARRSGLQFNLNSEQWGVQSLYSNFAQAGVVGLRGYVKPLTLASVSDIPIISNLEIGVTYASDFDTYANIDSFGANGKIYTNGSLSVLGADIGLPLFKNDLAKLELYYDFVSIVDYGHGGALGIAFSGDASEFLKVRMKLERRFNGDNYLPSYFNSFYEIERVDTTKHTAKSIVLGGLKGNAASNGYYGELLIRVVNTFDIIGTFQKLDRFGQSGILHLSTDIAPKDAGFIARAGYDKMQIRDFKDMLKTDERSYLFAELGYKPIDYIIISTVYMWTFSPIRDGDDKIIGYEPQKKIEPRITFVIPM